MKTMSKEEFIDKYILPNESEKNIIEYERGNIEFDEDYLQEIAEWNKIIIK